eukprot:251409_1
MNPYDYSQFLFQQQYQQLLIQQEKLQRHQSKMVIDQAKFNEIKRKLAPQYQASFKWHPPSENYGFASTCTTNTNKCTHCCSKVINGQICNIAHPHLHTNNGQNVIIHVHKCQKC